jgi:hypothetical protein
MENENKKLIETTTVKPKLTIWENEQEHRLIELEDEVRMDGLISQIETYMKNNLGYGESDNVKDILYADAQGLWNDYAKILRDVQFTFYINRKQYQYLTELLRDKLEYDVNTVFIAIELTNMLGTWVLEGTNKDDNSIRGYKANATEMTYMYHLIAKHKVKGLGQSTYTFAEILRRIGEISKVINYYDNAAKQLSTDIQNWVASFEDTEEGDKPEGENN